MSYVLWQGEPIRMRKGTISIWFRVPRESAQKITWTDDVEFAPLQNLIPILAFSGQHTGPWTEFTHPVINTFMRATSSTPPFDFQPFPYYGSIPGPTWDMPYHPCLIAVYIDKDKRATLAVVLQTMDIGVPQNTNQALTGAEGTSTDFGLFGPTSHSWSNASYADARMEWFDHNYGNGPEVKYDAWHHVLLSWDLQGSNSADGNPFNPEVGPPPDKPFHQFFTAKSILYCALDDINVIGEDLPTKYWTDNFGSNEIACTGCWAIAGQPYFTVPPDPDLSPPYTGFPRYSVTFGRGIEMDVVAVPSEPQYQQWLNDAASPATKTVDAIKKIEVAELQIFADFTLDTADASKRRAFIDFVEDNTDGGGDNNLMAPVDPKKTEEILGRRPDILLHKTKNWRNGKNTGSIGLERRNPELGDRIIEAGQFRPNGVIKKWKPDPRLLSEEGSSTA